MPANIESGTGPADRRASIAGTPTAIGIGPNIFCDEGVSYGISEAESVE